MADARCEFLTNHVLRITRPGTREDPDLWFIAYVDIDHGVLSILSGYGNWAYQWPAQKQGFRAFFINSVFVSFPYVAKKLFGDQEMEELDVEKFRSTLRRVFAEMYREAALHGAPDPAEYVDIIAEVNEAQGPDDLEDVMYYINNIDGEHPYDVAMRCGTPLRAFEILRDDFLPALAAAALDAGLAT